MRKLLTALALGALLALMAAGAYAAPPDEPGGVEDDLGGAPSPEKMQKVRERMRTLKMWQLTEALELDEKSSAKVFPVISEFDKKQEEHEVALMEGMRELKQTLDKPGSDAQVQALVERIEKSHRALQGLRDEQWQAMKKNLSSKQQGQYLLFEMQFKRQMRQMMDGGGRPGGGMGDRGMGGRGPGREGFPRQGGGMMRGPR